MKQPNALEKWRPIPGFPGYSASSDGAVRNESTGRKHAGHVLHQTGYVQACLAGRQKVAMHRLIALAFCPNFAPGMVVNHKNGDKRDNRHSNLEWVSVSENTAHAYRVLKSAHTKKAVESVCPKTGAVVQRFESGMAAFLAGGFSRPGISNCCQGRQGTHKGLKWRYAEHA
jgi:hypothetical protein